MHSSLGLDFGSSSVRALIVDCASGAELGSCTVDYRSGTQGIILDPADPFLARQNPSDYLDSLEKSVLGALLQASDKKGFSSETLIGIGVAATGSSPLPVDANNTPLAVKPEWQDHPDAQCWLWKDHTSHIEAAHITRLALAHRPQYIAQCGNAYSSEWFWAKIWHCLNVAPRVFEAAFSWVELCDYIPSLLAGIESPLQIRRGICAAGHKALYSEEWGGLPDPAFLEMLDPQLASLRERLYNRTYNASEMAGRLCPLWAEKLGLPAGIPIAIGEMDVHYGAIGCGVKEGTLIKVIGTSTCDCAVVSSEKSVANIPGICGIVKESILPGFYGIEAGQSAVGDIFQWWVHGVCGGTSALHESLSQEAAKIHPGQSGLIALDWNNGNRTVLVDQQLSGLLVGQTLYTTRVEIYRALIEGTAFGARVIIERLREYGVPIDRVICAGGIAEKNSLLMQIYADVLGCEMQVTRSSQACALGAAIGAAVAAKHYSNFKEAQEAMSAPVEASYQPNEKSKRIYDQLYLLYRQLHDAFGGVNSETDVGQLMKRLISLRDSIK